MIDTLTDRKFWRVHCHIGDHPGQWQYWFREQCCAVGWVPSKFHLDGKTDDRSWSTARNALIQMKEGDWVVASLPNSRVGRLGEIVKTCIRDDQWKPIVPPTATNPLGDNGRRILVRWDLTCGPDDPSKVVLLPEEVRFSNGQVRATVRQIPLAKLDPIRDAMCDEQNWVSLIGSFSLEAALSDYIALNPNLLEAGMISHLTIKAREHAFADRTRADVILQDRAGRTVVVECKQGPPSATHLKQLMQYRESVQGKFSDIPNIQDTRAILVHGGSSRVSPEIAQMARDCKIELVYHELRVNFLSSRP